MDLSNPRTQGILKSLGPGLLWAGAAIGVSHLVQSTRAGAGYGFALVWVILLVSLFKYPFFEYGPRYAAATGQSLLSGYKKLGTWTLVAFFIMTLGTMFTIIAAVTVVTASLVAELFEPIKRLSLVQWSAVLLVISGVVLTLGRYALLDRLTKIIIVILSVSTVVAVIVALEHGSMASPDVKAPELITKAGIAFMIALMGWMPSPVELSVWNSIWTIERCKQTGHKPTVKEALFDFNLAYVITTVLALCFLTLGAYVMYGTGEHFSQRGVVFADQFIKLYTQTLGSWTYPVIILAAITTMFSTTLTCADAYPRVLRRTTQLLVPASEKKSSERPLYIMWFVVVAVGALVLLTILKKNMTFMIDLATTISFLTAPVFAFLNYRLVTSKHMPSHAVPPLWLRVLSVAGLAFLIGFGMIFIWSYFFYGI